MMNKLYLIIVVVASTVMNVQTHQLVVPKDFSKIQTAVEKAEPGDTVLVTDGIYNENVTLKDNIILLGQSALTTIIRGKGNHPVIKAGDKTQIKNLSIENGRTGILCENVVPTIESCIIRNNKGTGIHCLIALPEILNNLILDNDWTGIYCESARSIKYSIQHNIIAENGYSGIMLSGQSEVLIQNNVFIKNRQFGIWAGEESRKSRIIYNDFFLNRLPNNTYAIVDKSNISEDPQYPSITPTVKNYFESEPVALKGKGQDGVNIGMMNKTELLQILNDSDRDGVPNDKDLCKDIPEDIDNFQDQDGCPDFDNDNDGIFDNQDLCPDSAEDFDNFKDDDGCPDLDNDNDGIPDSKDLCPNDKEVINGYKDDDGCPDEVPPVSPAAIKKENQLITPSAADSLKTVDQKQSTPAKK